jgi:hypothetical protein
MTGASHVAGISERMRRKIHSINFGKPLGRRKPDRYVNQQIKDKPIAPQQYNDKCCEDLPELRHWERSATNAGKRA